MRFLVHLIKKFGIWWLSFSLCAWYWCLCFFTTKAMIQELWDIRIHFFWPLVLCVSKVYLKGSSSCFCLSEWFFLGTNMKMVKLSTRSAFLCIMVASLLFYNFYSASVVSVRLSEPIFKMNDSLIELSKSEFKFISEWVVYFDYFMKVSLNINYNLRVDSM